MNNSVDLVIPPICNLCRCDLTDESRWLGLCDKCCSLVIESSDDYCSRCGNQSEIYRQEAATKSSEFCPKCKQTHFMFSRVFTLGPYQKYLRHAVLQTKHPHGYPLAVALGRLLAHVRKKEIDLFQPDLIIATPMHWLRRLTRGVNGPDAVANSVAKYLELPKSNRAIIRFRYTAQQVNLSQTQRLKNIASAFRLRGKNIAGKRILLIDDVMTTGATCNEVAKVLRFHGASDVAVGVVARQGLSVHRKAS